MSTPRVYLAGPYSSNPAANTRRAIEVADEIMALGLVPFVPHLTHFWEQQSPKPYAKWLEYDMHWLRCCQAFFRIEGESKGADLEEEEARRLGMPIYRTMDDLRLWVQCGCRWERM